MAGNLLHWLEVVLILVKTNFTTTQVSKYISYLYTCTYKYMYSNCIFIIPPNYCYQIAFVAECFHSNYIVLVQPMNLKTKILYFCLAANTNEQ